MVSILDILIEDMKNAVKKAVNFLKIEEVKEQHNNPSLKPKATTTERRDHIDRHGNYISIFDRDRPYGQTKTPEELAYLKSKDKPRMRERTN